MCTVEKSCKERMKALEEAATFTIKSLEETQNRKEIKEEIDLPRGIKKALEEAATLATKSLEETVKEANRSAKFREEWVTQNKKDEKERANMLNEMKTRIAHIFDKEASLLVLKGVGEPQDH
ncbi:hypothetical protein JTE90_005663 [Oedothorax gibbosus]|uniref:Stathmin n=1 Tax=Oedothorax gibbosus TaxID=931172 RepID=A0AAV6UG93_9ARAC|nr:hypothetical protein JTE90_005663 [Oedothorax gibbosus]